MVSQSMLDQAYQTLGSTYGGVKNDYFAPLYLQEQFKISFDPQP